MLALGNVNVGDNRPATTRSHGRDSHAEPALHVSRMARVFEHEAVAPAAQNTLNADPGTYGDFGSRANISFTGLKVVNTHTEVCCQ